MVFVFFVFPTLISCSPNLQCVYIRLCKHGNHFTFLQRNCTVISTVDLFFYYKKPI